MQQNITIHSRLLNKSLSPPLSDVWTFKVLVCSWVFIDHETEMYFLNE